MKNIYGLLKLNRYIQSIRIKCMGIYCLHIFGKRYIGIFLDPVLACNLRCKMCHFSVPEKNKKNKGRFSMEDLTTIGNALFSRALKLQIGCGAEPTIFAHNKDLIKLAKKHKIPYISMTTNANLPKESDWWEFVEAGLDEITISLHGVQKESYEFFMEGASFEKFHAAMATFTEIKKKFPKFNIRINYTVNSDNLDELKDFFEIFGNYNFDILQIRPIQNFGDTVYNNFSWDEITEKYDEIIQKVKDECMKRKVICMSPNKKDLTNKDSMDHSFLMESTYCYIGPKEVWRKDFDWQNETYNDYAKRTKLGKRLFKNIFRKKNKDKNNKQILNYGVS